MSNKHLGKLFVLLLVLGGAEHAIAYKEPTHELMAITALDRSALTEDLEVLRATNLWSLREQYFPASDGNFKNVRNLVGFGATNEDEGVRSLRHFFDPTNDSGLRVLGTAFMASPDWALQDSDAPYNSSQEFAYRDAKEHYRRALTVTDTEEHKRLMGLTFQTIGQVIHHIQDMAQPEHVRNDPHLAIPIPLTEKAIPIDPSVV